MVTSTVATALTGHGWTAEPVVVLLVPGSGICVGTMTALADTPALVRLLRTAKAARHAGEAAAEPIAPFEPTGFEFLGAEAFADGRRRRLVPRHILTDHGPDAARGWYRGWDQARDLERMSA